MGKTCRRNRKNRRGGWSLKFWKKKPKYKKQQITNQERREYSAALETAAHAGTEAPGTEARGEKSAEDKGVGAYAGVKKFKKADD